MKGLHDSSIGDFTRGGQTTLMMVRMIFEVIRRFGGLALLVYSLTTVSLFFGRTTAYQRYLLMRYAGAAVAVQWLGHAEALTDIRNSDGSVSRVRVKDIYEAAIMRQTLYRALHLWIENMVLALLITGTGGTVLLWLVLRFGRSQREEERLRGGRILPAEAVRRSLVSKGLASALSVAGVPLINGKETSHLLLSGGPGTGKSTTIYTLMAHVRQRGDRCICFSTSGDFIEWFYRQGEDVLLNPFDDRCPSWDLWQECTQSYHYDMLASALIPDSGSKDPFWVAAARVVFAALTRRMAENGDHDVPTLLHLLSEVSLKELGIYLADTEAAALLDPANEKTAAGIRTTATTFARSLKYLPVRPDSFHIRRWVDHGSTQWVFLNARSDQLEASRPLLSAWLEVFTNSILSLPADRERRIWLIIDELPALYRISSLESFLAQGRKFGGCGVIAFQQISQLRDRYGKDGAETLSGLCATWICLRQNDPITAQWAADAFGEAEYAEQQEGLQYGSHEMRDGVSLSQQRKMRPLLLPAQIRELDDLEGYIRLPGSVPSAHFRMNPIRAPKLAEAFVKARVVLALPPPKAEVEVTQGETASSTNDVVVVDTQLFPSPSSRVAESAQS